MQLTICEKPSQARYCSEALSKHLNINIKNENGGLTSPNIVITYAVGHLLQLANPALYNPKFKQWRLEDLPILPDQFKLQINEKTKKQFNIIKALISKAKILYNATDAEREGELIFRFILTGTQNENFPNVKRIWAHDLELQTIFKAYQNAEDQSNYNNLYLSAKARCEADWLIGINATRSLSVAANKNKVLSIGRVQTIVLKLIVARHKTLKAFVKKPLFTPHITLKSNPPLELKLNHSFKDLNDANSFIEDLPNKIELLKNEDNKLIKQPPLYSLPDLYIETNKSLNLSATQTLQIAQSLYEKGFISYPRTDSNYLTTNQIDTAKKTLIHLVNLPLKWQNKSLALKDFIPIETLETHFIFNNSKTSDHYAIIPLNFNQTNYKQNLKEEEINVLNLIVIRFFRTFMPKAHVTITTYTAKHTSFEFYTRDQIIKNQGHFLLQQSSHHNPLPDIEPKIYDMQQTEIKKGFTSPPKLYTEATLISAMRNPLNHETLEDDTHNSSLKSIGTPATIDSYLPLLMKRDYVKLIKKNIEPLDLGISIIEQLNDNKITSINLTAEIEHTISKISKGEISYESFIASIKNYTKTLTQHIVTNAESISKNVKVEEQERHNCPKCNTGFLYLAKSKRNYYCSNFKANPACDFILFTNIAGKKLPKKQILNLIGDKRITDLIQFINKKNVKYKAQIVLNKDFKTEFKFSN